MGRRGWGIGLAVVVALGALTVAGRALDLATGPAPAPAPAPSPSTTAARPPVRTTAPPATFPRALARPLRLPSPPPDGSCPASPPARDPNVWSGGPHSAALGDGPVYPVLALRPSGQPDQTSPVRWVAPKPPAGVAIVRGQRLGMPDQPVRFQAEDETVSAVQVLDPAAAGRTGDGGRWWRTFLLRAGVGCYGLQIDGAAFSEVVVVDFRPCCRPYR
jgi:hypothetical protein